ncbi:DNA polymerase III subunit gamma/tau [Aureliella helgolandensis]|uniref:DNA polymerase III subunit gamma/tau n=1 Tax=Aureliella helgolandensis TaxID=2527968 RepID=A0A518GEL2_9BACT|nr:DNA polymerase III subunit gamma/tau [Aureliella helgolandensis]QDV27000.1 DNA polymerase III subunit tau [Aureliella helgolandensis]
MVTEATDSNSAAGYTVVARRYRPLAFDELVGQGHVAQALEKAIATGRVGHAYLFTGARGVGKTSTARIFAKALNSPEGIAPELAADIAQAVDAGEDMDVIEIDGASNRGIEEIRTLRANVNVRPSRSRYKIYIIDEVHMLTNQAFNALLKTLEEPPAHVKFIFCTTDPDKIPITVLSRCQRFDFAPVKFEAIQKRLKEITTAEGFTADDEALALLARRAAGSMRDSQSLLEQVMSFSTDRISVEQVHQLLGTADEGRLLAIAEALCDADALKALSIAEEATRSGADPGQLAEQLLNYFRDIMAVGVGGGPDLLKLANPVGHPQLQELASRWGLQTILSAIQIVDESLVRMRTSVSAVTLLEVALVQICQLEKLASIPALLEAALRLGTTTGGGPAAASAGEKKNNSPNVAEPVSTPPARPIPAIPAAARPAERHDADRGETQPASAPTASVATPVAAKSAAPPVSNPSPPGNSAPAPAPPESVAVANAVSPPSQTLANAVATPALESSTSAQTKPAPAAPATEPAATPASASAAQRQPAAPIHGSTEALAAWKKAVSSIDGMLADFAGMAIAVEPQGSDSWNVVYPPGATKITDYCEQADRRALLQQTLDQSLGRTVRISFSCAPGEPPKLVAATPQATIRVQKLRQVSEDPFVKKVCEVLDAEVVRVDPPRIPPPG